MFIHNFMQQSCYCTELKHGLEFVGWESSSKNQNFNREQFICSGMKFVWVGEQATDFWFCLTQHWRSKCLIADFFNYQKYFSPAEHGLWLPQWKLYCMLCVCLHSPSFYSKQVLKNVHSDMFLWCKVVFMSKLESTLVITKAIEAVNKVGLAFHGDLCYFTDRPFSLLFGVFNVQTMSKY